MVKFVEEVLFPCCSWVGVSGPETGGSSEGENKQTKKTAPTVPLIPPPLP